MESPATWGPVEHAIAEALEEAEEARRAKLIGLSTVRQIADKLRAKGLVSENEECECLAGNCTCQPAARVARGPAQVEHARRVPTPPALVVDHEYLDPQQIREMQNVFQQRQAIILPEGRIIEETFPVR